MNEKTLAEKEKGLGRFLLFSTDSAMDADTMFELYFQRDAIEKVFETMKGELSLGPIRYRRTDRLESYATIVYVAYLLWSWAERKLTAAWPEAAREVRKKYPTLTLSRAVDLLEGVSWVRFGAKKSVRDWTTRLTDVQEEILGPLGAKKFLPAT
ncbi:transposase IS4 family protein [mine drainage metagenome]|uniref:Transposase IS4 family protein n=1 Tax=mine drainage metagenome TaxID=410659 RepID=T0ZTJ0_9ZZZZ